MTQAKTRSQRQLAGTDRPGRVSADEMAPPEPLPAKPPSWISQAAANDYKRLAPQLEGIATARDVDTLAAYCTDLALYRRLSAQCVKVTDALAVDSRDNEKPSGIFEAINKLSTRMDRRAKALGLTPESRGVKAPASQAKDESPANPFAEL